MYVKVNQAFGGSDFLIEVSTTPILSGTVAVNKTAVNWADPSYDIGHELAVAIFGTDESYLTSPWDELHVLQIDNEGQSEYERQNDLLAVKYAWWAENDSRKCVVTTRNIFIVGNDGKTVDRVR